jgi:hypothetical protein
MPDRTPDEGKPGAGVEGFIPELVRKAVERSVQAVLQSEEGMRGVVSALMPREVLSNVVQQLDGAKRDVVTAVGRELQSFLQNLNVGEELTKILTSVRFEVNTSVRFIPNEDGTLRSEVSTSARPVVAPGSAKPRRKRGAKSPSVKSDGAQANGAKAGGRVRRAAAAIVDRAAEIAGDKRKAKD